MAWQKNGTPNTLTSTTDTIDITDLGGFTFNQFLDHNIQTTGVIDAHLRYNADTGSNYAYRRKINSGTEDVITSTTTNSGASGTAGDNFLVVYGFSLATEEKLFIGFSVNRNTAGAGTAPVRSEMVGKWVNTSDTLTGFLALQTEAGSYDTDSNLSALGTD